MDVYFLVFVQLSRFSFDILQRVWTRHQSFMQWQRNATVHESVCLWLYVQSAKNSLQQYLSPKLSQPMFIIKLTMGFVKFFLALQLFKAWSMVCMVIKYDDQRNVLERLRMEFQSNYDLNRPSVLNTLVGIK